MDHTDRWRNAALIGAAAGFVALPALGGVLFLGVMARSTRRLRPALAWRPALAAASVLVLIAVSGAASVQGFLLTLGLAAIGPALSLWSAVARSKDVEAIAVGFAVGMGAHVVAALTSAQGVPIAGLTFHPNVLGAIVAMAIPSLAALTLGRRNGAWWSGSTVLVLLAITAATGSRGAMAAALVGAGWMVFHTVLRARAGALRPRARWPLVLAAVVSLAAVLALWATVRQPSTDEALGLTGRSTLWGVALEMIVDRPVLGHGPKAWARGVESVEPSVRAHRFPHAHSGYLEIALDYGLVGLSVVVAFVVFVFRALGRRRAGTWSVAAQATWLAFAVANVGDAFVLDARFLAMAGLVTGAAWARSSRAVNPPLPTPPPPTSSPTSPTPRARPRA